MSDDRCACCGLPPGQCGVATEKAQADERRAQRVRALMVPGTIVARYLSKCPSCGTRITPGDPLRRNADREYVGALCCPDEGD